ncbi:MAG: 50S ribosomal protein L27 [Candidatus Nomurabacteria bacterium]|mgnify:FL=1|nr:MAG: 50S ribosomal protein L27 [Candidatus Nomurabacteria bacterium]HRV75770.1 50S ribosomal protein L27 [Candidatus Saccharimonadales bacterium]
MSKVAGGGSVKRQSDSPGQRLGVKRYAGQKVSAGEIIIRQVGATKIAGPGTFVSRNFTIHAAKDGVVRFQKRKMTKFTGRTTSRVQVIVE